MVLLSGASCLSCVGRQDPSASICRCHACVCVRALIHASAGSSSKDLVGCTHPAGMACARRSGTLPCCMRTDAVCRTPLAGSAHAFCAQRKRRRGRTASCRCALTGVYGQFARVAKGVDLTSTAGNCAWARAPQLTLCALHSGPVVWRKLLNLFSPPGSFCIDLSMPRFSCICWQLF